MYTLPYYAATSSLKSLAQSWSQPPWFKLDASSHTSVFQLDVYAQKPPAVIVAVDEWLLKESFIASVRAIASVRYSTIVAVVESDDEALLVDSLQQGADRVVAVPQCNDRIFCALIKTLLPGNSATTLSYSPYTLYTRTQTVCFDNNRIRLRRRQFEVAHYLFVNNGHMVSRDTLLREVWGLSNDLYLTRRVEQQISLTKRHLALDGTHGWYLRAGRGRNRGYGIFRE